MSQLPVDQGLTRFKQNEERLDNFVNNDGYVSSSGQPVESLPIFLDRMETEVKQTTGTVAANLQASEAAVQAAEAARDAALVNSPTYPDEPTGRAAVADGAYFKVQGSGDVAAYEYRRVNVSSSTLIAVFPSAGGVERAVTKSDATTIIDIGDYTVFNVTQNSFSVSSFRWGYDNGWFTYYSPATPEVFSTPENNTYIIADLRTVPATLSKGTRAHVWEEIPYLEKNMAILAYKEVDRWRSFYPSVQRQLDRIDERFTEVVNKNDYEVINVWNELTITGNPAQITIGAFAIIRRDGAYIIHTTPETFSVPGVDGYIIAEFGTDPSNTVQLSLGTRATIAAEFPYLTFTRIMLAYKINGRWYSDHAPIQHAIDENPALGYPRNTGTIYDIGSNTTVTAGTVFNITSFRYGRQDGSLIAYTANETFLTPNRDHYIVCDVSGSVPVLTLGTRDHAWEEYPFTSPNRFVLAVKEVWQWTSDFPSVQRLIDYYDTLQGKFTRLRAVDYYDIGEYTRILSAGSTFSIGAFRFGREDGSYGAYTGTDVFSTPGDNHYIIVDFSAFAFTLTLGTRGHVWEEVPYLKNNQAILAYKEAGAWRSNIVGVQRLLDLFNSPGSGPVTTIEKVVRAGGTVGVDCDYTSLVTALNELSDGSYNKRYIVQLVNGTYDYSSDGALYLGFRNYVTVKGQTRNGVKVIKRHPTFSSAQATFDAAHYGVHLEYSALENLTVIAYNGKGPVHADSSVWGEGTIELIDCNLITEDGPSSPHYQVGLACGLNQGQKVISRNCRSNGIMYAHNNSVDYLDNGCSFELYNCVMPYTVIGDLQTYGKDFYKIVGCKLEFIEYAVTDVFGVRSYLQPTFELDLHGTEVEYIKGTLSVSGLPADGLWDYVFGGKHGVFVASIHSYNVCPTGTIAKGGLVALSNEVPMGIKPWTAGDQLYGVALDAFNGALDYGTVQHSGIVFMSASGSTAIAYNDQLELNSSGVAVKRTTGPLLGYARDALGSGSGTIRVKLSK